MKRTLLLCAMTFGSACVGMPPAQESGEAELPIRDNHPTAPGDLLGMVKVLSNGKMCSGMLIANDTVLTAAHCFCGEDLVGSNSCEKTGSAVFRPNPAVPGSSTV